MQLHGVGAWYTQRMMMAAQSWCCLGCVRRDPTLCRQSAGRVVGLPWLPAGSQELVPLAPGPAFGSEAPLQFQCNPPVLAGGCEVKLPALGWPSAGRVSLSKGWCCRTHTPCHSASHQSEVSGYNGVSCATFFPGLAVPSS